MKQNRIHQRALSILLSLALVFSIFAIDTVGASAASDDGRTTKMLDSDITITDSGRYVITQQDSRQPVTHTISVTSGAPNIELENVNIDVHGNTDKCAFSIAPGAAVTLTLIGTNMLVSGGGCAGLRVPAGPDANTPDASLTITEQSTGSLNATGAGYDNGIDICVGGAGIGGSNNESGGQITVNGGTVTAIGGAYGAGIGGGNGCVSAFDIIGGDGGNITINGGTVTATGGVIGAGIGGGSEGDGTGTNGTISINGGMVTANGGGNSAGIGGGGYGNGTGNQGTIKISGGLVTTNGSYGGAGIGGGYYSSGTGTDGTISISGGSVTATGGDNGAGIGGGEDGDSAGTISISGGMVTATCTENGAGIGGSGNGSGGNVTITGTDTEVTAQGRCDIGSGSRTGRGWLSISSGATVVMPGIGTDASLFTHTDCFVITGRGNSRIDTYYGDDGNAAPGHPVIVNATLTAEPDANGGLRMTAKATNGSNAISTGSFTFAYNDQGTTHTENADVDAATGTASCDFGDLPANGLRMLTAKYRDSSHTYDALISLFCYSPDAIDLSTVHADGFGGCYTYSHNTVTLAQNGWYVFTGSTTANIIEVPNGVSACVTLDHVSIDVSGYDYTCAFSLDPGAEVNLILKNDNTLKSGGGSAGLRVPASPDTGTPDASLTITGQSTDSLNATGAGDNYLGSGGAGIGGTFGSSGNITIIGGTIMAQGGTSGYHGGAGIGGSSLHNGPGPNSRIVINGGTVLANGGLEGAGIGGGAGNTGNGGNIVITGGTVNATGGNNGGTGIGGGYCGSGCTVQISGNAEVHAKGQNGSHDIGSGLRDNSITGGTLLVAGTDLNNGPTVELQSAGTDAAISSGTAHQFTNCEIWGTGAKSTGNTDISGCYDANGKIRLSADLSATPKHPGSTAFGSPVTLIANIARVGFQGIPTLSGKLLFLCDGQAIGTPVSLTSGAASVDWTPSDAAEHQLTVQYQATNGEAYAINSEDVTPCPYSAGKAALTVKTPPIASQIPSGSKLSASALTGGTVTDANGTTIPGTFAWAHPDTVVTASGSYEAIFTPNDGTNYNTALASVPVTVTAAPTPSSGNGNSSGTSTLPLPSGVMDTVSNVQADLSGATMPAGVTSVTLSVTPETASGTPTTPETTDVTTDPQGASVFHLAIASPSLNIIGTPFLYNIKLLDQNGNPITGFSGKVTVRIPIPAGLHGAPHVFRYEESTGTFVDRNAVVENGFLVFSTEHFSYYMVAGVGDSVTLDTKSYQMPVKGQYQIGVKLTGGKAASVKVNSTNGKIATVERLNYGNVQVTAKGTGTAYIMIDVYDSKSHLLTHASVRVDVKTGIRPRGDSVRQIGVF